MPRTRERENTHTQKAIKPENPSNSLLLLLTHTTTILLCIVYNPDPVYKNYYYTSTVYAVPYSWLLWLAATLV